MKLKQAAAQQKGGAPAKNAPSKPLSLEYMADRLDVDDPLHAILIRTNDNIGMLQGERGSLGFFCHEDLRCCLVLNFFLFWIAQSRHNK